MLSMVILRGDNVASLLSLAYFFIVPNTMATVHIMSVEVV